jgi:polyhydroxybutyrate depolymerase
MSGLYLYYIYVPKVEEPSLSGNYERSAIRVDGQDRTFSTYIPKDLKQSAAMVFVLHGSRGTGDRIRRATAYEFDLLADRYGFLVIYPDGFEKHWNDCRGSADYLANTENIDDPAFFQQMINTLVETNKTNRDEVFVTGLSNGGHMAYRLALEIPEQFSAVAAMAANLPVDSVLDCKKSNQPISVAIFNGTTDPLNPYEGGLVSLLGNDTRGVVMSANATVDYWRETAGITSDPARIDHAETDQNSKTSVTQSRWLGIDGTDVRLYTLNGSGHVVPSKIAKFPRLLGGDAGDISGPEETILFFFGLDRTEATGN